MRTALFTNQYLIMFSHGQNYHLFVVKKLCFFFIRLSPLISIIVKYVIKPSMGILQSNNLFRLIRVNTLNCFLLLCTRLVHFHSDSPLLINALYSLFVHVYVFKNSKILSVILRIIKGDYNFRSSI